MILSTLVQLFRTPFHVNIQKKIAINWRIIQFLLFSAILFRLRIQMHQMWPDYRSQKTHQQMHQFKTSVFMLFNILWHWLFYTIVTIGNRLFLLTLNENAITNTVFKKQFNTAVNWNWNLSWIQHFWKLSFLLLSKPYKDKMGKLGVSRLLGDRWLRKSADWTGMAFRGVSWRMTGMLQGLTWQSN